MAGSDELLATIEAINAAGFDAERWPDALAAVAGVVGGTAATIEHFAKATLRPRSFYFHGVPPPIEMKYIDQYARLNRRIPLVMHSPVGSLHWDYRMFDERTIEHDPFYMDFLTEYGLRYFTSGMIVSNQEEFAGVCVHRSPKQGHIDEAGLAVMERLVPHVRAAFDVTRRLKAAEAARSALESAFDWLADGVALVLADGLVVHANSAFEAIVRQRDGVCVDHGRIDFAGEDARDHFATGLAAIDRLHNGDTRYGSIDFAVRRPSGAPAYVFSLRPLPSGWRAQNRGTADAVVFVRDPATRNPAAIAMLRDYFGLTEAESNLAEALRTGMPLGEYAVGHAVTLNTVYTHLRGIKEKTRCRRLPELTRRLNELVAAARSS